MVSLIPYYSGLIILASGLTRGPSTTLTDKINPAELPAPGLCELVDVITASIKPRRFATMTFYRAHNALGCWRAGRMAQTPCLIAGMWHFTLAS